MIRCVLWHTKCSFYVSCKLKPPDARRLLELREGLVQECKRTARLLDAAIQAKYSVLDPDSLEVIKDLSMEHLKERQNVINRRLEALEEQIDLLKQHEDRVRPLCYLHCLGSLCSNDFAD